MTSAESTLLGIVIGAALAWLGNVLSSRAQWRREEQRRLAERRTELYQDMFVRTRYLVRVQKLHGIEPHPEATPEAVAELDRWSARVSLFASTKVSMLWDIWFTIHMQGWEIHRTKLETLEDRRRYAAHGTRREQAHEAIVDQMRREIGFGTPRGRIRGALPRRQSVER
ncbi:hypothetical protein KDL01_04310 [Actinospica durhamensis]|uniref:Uncharacterized protein n=1 Tax=Actinospica durhamensis TaxID=1508375 RepID=A0A941IRN8_9ACTN|nr:hypothetical protein [Actinospica durhamensis]MBR7832466.1 hypothetical protein [Actinospica durhamensis]